MNNTKNNTLFILLLGLVLTITSSISFAVEEKRDNVNFRIGKSMNYKQHGKDSCKQIWNTDGKIVQDGDALYLYGGVWTGGKLVDGRKDGNAVRGGSSYNLKSQRLDMVYTVYGDDYCEFGCGIMPRRATWEEFRSADKGYIMYPISTGRSEKGSYVVESGTKIYATLIFDEKDNSILEAISTGGFWDDEGSKLIHFTDFDYSVSKKTAFDNRMSGTMVFYLHNNEGGANSYMVIDDVEAFTTIDKEEIARKKEDSKNKIIVNIKFHGWKKDGNSVEQNVDEENNNNSNSNDVSNSNNSNNGKEYPNFALHTAHSWAFNGIISAKLEGLYTTGMMEQNFKEFATREQFTELALLLFEKLGGTADGTENPFVDTDNDSIIRAYNAGIINGVSEDRFAPNDLLTREQLCAILVGILDKSGISYDVNMEFQKEYVDLDQISDWAYPSVRMMNGYKIMNGDGDKLLPKDNVTREMAVLMLERVYEVFTE